MKRLLKTLLLAVVGIAAGAVTAEACTNFIVTKGASTDGSNMVTYAADSHSLYGVLYSHVPGKFTEYIDVNEGMTDENGDLRADFAIEGMHMWATAYVQVFKNMLPYLQQA